MKRKVRAGAQCRNPEAGAKAEAIEEHCLLACSDLFLYTQDHLPGSDTAANDLNSPTPITNQDKVPYICPHASLMEVFSQLRFLFSDKSSFVKLPTTTKSYNTWEMRASNDQRDSYHSLQLG